MDLGKITLIIILSLLAILVIVSIWWMVFVAKVRKIENSISEKLQVIDVVLAVQKEFINKLALLVLVKEIPKAIILNPQYSWSSLEREAYIKGLKDYLKDVNKAVKSLKKTKNKEVINALKQINESDERLQSYLFIYNNKVLEYNYLLKTRQAKFFLKREKHFEKELINEDVEKDLIKDLIR